MRSRRTFRVITSACTLTAALCLSGCEGDASSSSSAKGGTSSTTSTSTTAPTPASPSHLTEAESERLMTALSGRSGDDTTASDQEGETATAALLEPNFETGFDQANGGAAGRFVISVACLPGSTAQKVHVTVTPNQSKPKETKTATFECPEGQGSSVYARDIMTTELTTAHKVTVKNLSQENLKVGVATSRKK